MTTASRKETEKTKLLQDKCQSLLTQMLRDEDNKYCVDCDAKGPRWASWNLGVFLCIRCAGIHRNLGVHISRVKSVNLDTWTPEQVISLQQMGNSRARAVYEAQLPDGFRRPQTDTALESFIRAKYEHKKYLAREWVPPSPPKVDWGKEIDDELEKQKRKKKAAQASSSLGIGVMGSSSGGGDKKSITKSSPLPAPLPKPKPGQSGSSPKTQRVSNSSTAGDHSNDLLGLSSPTKPIQSGNISALAAVPHDLNNDSFSGFLSATPVVNQLSDSLQPSNNPHNNFSQNSLAKEEEDFFNQATLGGNSCDKDKSGKMTKDSILALYGAVPSNAASVSNNTIAHNPHNPQMNFGQPQPPIFTATGAGFTGMSPGYMSAAGGAPHMQHPQFMTPPNSTSMYNAPVMTAPNAFTTPGGSGAVFGVQYHMSNASTGYPQQMTGMNVGGSMVAAQVQHTGVANGNLMFTNQSLLRGSPMNSHTQIGGTAMPMSTMSAAGFQPSSSANTTANLNQQFGNLNIGNVWQ